MTGDCHVRFYESGRARFPPATHQASKTRGHFPDDDSALKLLRLIGRDISTTRGGDAATGTWGWKEALNAFDIHFPGRLNI